VATDGADSIGPAVGHEAADSWVKMKPLGISPQEPTQLSPTGSLFIHARLRRAAGRQFIGVIGGSKANLRNLRNLRPIPLNLE
jgi:hypothetical protein